MRLRAKHKPKPRWGLAVIAALVLISAIPAPAKTAGPDKVVLRLMWVHQAQFAGFYLAKDLGIYAKHGLEVTIKAGGPAFDPLEELAKRRCDFALAWLADGITRHAQGTELVLLAQIAQNSAMLLVAKAHTGISKLSDLDGRRVGLWGGHLSLAPRALFKQHGIRVREVPQTASVEPFVMKAVAVASAMRFNELHRIYQAGVDLEDLVIFDLAKLGFNFPEDGIYALEQTWRKRPDVCRRFVAASLEGWRLALQDPKQALASVMRRINRDNLASNLSHQTWMLRGMRGLIMGENPNWSEEMGQLDPMDFDLVNRILVDHGIISGPVDRKAMIVPGWSKQP